MPITKKDIRISIQGRDAGTLSINASYTRSAVVDGMLIGDSVQRDIMAQIPTRLKEATLAAVEALATWVEAN